MHFSIFGLEVAPWMFAVATLGWCGWEVGRLWLAVRSEFWPHVVGTIEEAIVDNRPDSDGDDFFVPKVRYVYSVAGDSYVGKRLAFRPKGSYKYESILDSLQGVTESQKHRVYFHPKHPHLSVLKPGAGWANYVLIFLLVAVACVAIYAQITSKA